MAIKTIGNYRFFFITFGPSVAAMTIDLTPARCPFVVVVYEMLVGGGVLTVLGLASGKGSTRWTIRHARGWRGPTWSGFGSVVAFSAYVWLLQSAAVSLAATYAYVNPLVAVLLGRLILAEPVTMPTIVGGAVAVVAVAIVVSSERPPGQPPLQKTHERRIR